MAVPTELEHFHLNPLKEVNVILQLPQPKFHVTTMPKLDILARRNLKSY